jgi:hypothetical protein
MFEGATSCEGFSTTSSNIKEGRREYYEVCRGLNFFPSYY